VRLANGGQLPKVPTDAIRLLSLYDFSELTKDVSKLNSLTC
jgi:hypothetical protein